MTMTAPPDRDQQSRRILQTVRTIAVLGYRDEPSAPGHYVAAYLAEQGYRVIGVNPKLAGEQRFGQTVVASLGDLEGPVDLVDVFRRAEALPGHLDEFLALAPADDAAQAEPPVVWFQLGIRNDEVAASLREAGFEVVQDRCTLAEHRRLGLGAVSTS